MTLHIFDVDGTLIASNKAKSHGFWLTAANRWGEDIADQVVAYHQQAGSISREARWQHIFEHIVGYTPSGDEFEHVLDSCTRHITDLCAKAAPVPGAREFVESCEERMVVSGITQPELGQVLEHHGLAHLFSGVFGGHKGPLLKRLVQSGTVHLPAVYYGDTRDDWLSATEAGLDFVLVTADTEWAFFDEYTGPRISDFTRTVAA